MPICLATDTDLKTTLTGGFFVYNLNNTSILKFYSNKTAIKQ